MGKIEKSIVVNVPVSTAYNQLTRFTEFPRFMEGVQEVRQLDDTHLHWHMLSNGEEREWDAEITEKVPDTLIAWRNTSGPKNTGQIVLEPTSENKTKLTLRMDLDQNYAPEHAQSMENELSQRNEQDLVRFKKFMESKEQETGEWRGEANQMQDNEQPPRMQQANEPVSWLPRLMDAWEEPLAAMRRMSEEMERLFARFVGQPLGMPNLSSQSGARSSNWMPLVEVAQRDNQLIICADLPGIKREDVHVEIKKDKLTIEGDRHPQTQMQEQQAYRRTERPYGHFYRMISLPEGIDPNAAAASMHDGVLEITVPVIPPTDMQGKRLNIQSPSSH